MRIIGFNAVLRRYLLIALLLASAAILLVPYVFIHARVILDPWPVTLREPAFILQAKQILEVDAPPMYSLGSLPDNPNLYGPIYPLLALPAVVLMPELPYVAHRLTVALFLLGSCFLIGLCVSRSAGWVWGVLAGTLYYVATVATPSLAAGPDTAATFFYIASIAVILFRGCNLIGTTGCFVFGTTALLTKPYLVLAIPGILAYVFLFLSPKRAILGFGALVFFGLALGWGINCLWPEYYFSVMGIHSAAATRVFSEFRNQSIEFFYLNFASILLFMEVFPWAKAGMITKWRFRDLKWDGPVFGFDIGWDRFMVLLAIAVLALSLGWHGGAYMIYYNHLLLPPLLIASFRIDWLNRNGRGALSAGVLVFLNIFLLALLTPSIPRFTALTDLSKFPRVLADPYLEPLTKYHPGWDIVDNAQGEYISLVAGRNGGPEFLQVQKWENWIAGKLYDQEYDALLLTPIHNRKVLISGGVPSWVLDKKYEHSGVLRYYPYYFSFRDRSSYGKVGLNIYLYTRRNTTSLP